MALEAMVAMGDMVAPEEEQTAPGPEGSHIKSEG